MSPSISSQFLFISGALCSLLSAYVLHAAPLVPAAAVNSTSEQALMKTDDKSQLPSSVHSHTPLPEAINKSPAANSLQQPSQPAAAPAAAPVVAAAAATKAEPSALAAASAAAAETAAVASSQPASSSSAAEAATLGEATGLDLTGDVAPQRYSDLDLLLANWNEAESIPETNDVGADDDEAMLQQLFTRDSRPSDVDLSPRAMAQYLLLTDDFNGVQQAIQDLVSTGLLTADEAGSYRDEVSLEYASMVQQKFLPQREQRDVPSYQVQDDNNDDGDAYDADVRSVRDGAAVDYAVYDNSLPLIQPVLPADDELPISAELAQLDARVLEELLRQQQRQHKTQPAAEYLGNNNNNNDDDELFLQAVEPDTSSSSLSLSRARVSNESPADDVTNYDGQQASLEAELESLPVEVVTQQQREPAVNRISNGIENGEDETEAELEQIGKLLQDAGHEESSRKKP